MSKRITMIVLVLTLLPLMAMGAISLDEAIPAGPNVVLTGSGAPADGPVELVVNGTTAAQTFADASGDFTFTGVSLSAGDDVRLQASYVWNFNTDGDFEGWVAGNPAHLGLQVTGGSLVCTTLSPGSSPNINNPLSNFPGGEIDGSVYRVWEVRMKNNTDVNLLRFPYTPTGGSIVWRTDGSLDLAVATATSGFETYRFSDSRQSTWDQPITGIRMDMRGGTDSAGTVEIDYIRLNENVAYEFDIDGDSGYFNFANVTNTAVNGGTLHMEATSTDPNFKFQNSTIPASTYSIDQTDFTQIYIGGTWTNATVADFGFRYNSSYIRVNPGASVNTPTVWHMNLPGYTPTAGANWNTAAVNLTTIRIDPHEGASGTYDFDYVRLTPGSAHGPFDGSATDIDTTPTWVNTTFDDTVAPNGNFSMTFLQGTDFYENDGDTVYLSLANHSGPGAGDWLDFGSEATSMTLSGSPSMADLGIHTWDLVASDGSKSSKAVLTVTVTNTAPNWLTGSYMDSVYAGGSYSISFAEGVDFDDAEGGPFSLSVQSYEGVGTGAWLDFGTGASSFTLSGTPALSDVGISTWTLSVSDGAESDTTLLALEVVDPDAVVTVVVDDDAGNDAAYVNGVGGNFTGPSALKDAVTAINGDSSLRNNWEIRIIDTDGVGDLYSGTLSIQKDRLTIHQVPNGSVDDAACQIDAGSDGDNVVLNVFSNDFTFSGLSEEEPVSLEIPNATPPNVGVAFQPARTGAAFHNLTITSGTTAGKLAMNLNGVDAELSGITVDGVTDGIQIASGCVATISSSTLAAAGYPVRLFASASAFISNSRLVGDSQYIDLTSFERLELIDCEIDYTSASVGIFNPGYLANDSEILIVNPTIPGPTVTLPFNFGEQRTSITIRGNGPDDKADLTQIGEGKLLLRARAANVTFMDCLIGNEIESRGGVAAPIQGAHFSFDRCYVNASVGEAQISGITRNITATNTIFEARTSQTVCLDMRQATSVTQINLTHCTLFGQTGGEQLIDTGGSTLTMTADYCIFDGAGLDWVSEEGEISGTGNLVAPGASGGFADASGLVNTVGGPATLDSVGMPHSTSAAFDGAAGSTMAIDYNGTLRPIGDSPDIGAYEAPMPEAGVESWELY